MSRMTSYIPTLDQIDELHQKIAPSQAAYDLVHMHCVVVATIARQLARHQNALFTNKLGQGSGNALDDSAGAAEQADLPSDGITGGRVPKRLIDEHLATIGGLLHDIGTYRVLKHDGSDGEPLQFDGKRYILHGLLGYEYLLEQGVDESIAQFARNHTGVGLTQQMVIAQNLPLPHHDLQPETIEEKLICYADKFYSKSHLSREKTIEQAEKSLAKFGGETLARFRAIKDIFEPEK